MITKKRGVVELSKIVTLITYLKQLPLKGLKVVFSSSNRYLLPALDNAYNTQEMAYKRCHFRI